MVTLKDPKHLEGCLCAQTVNSLLLLKRQREHHAGFESGLPKHAHSICLYVQKEYTLKQKGYGKRASLSYKNSCRELAVSHLKVGCAVDVGLCCGTRQGTDAGECDQIVNPLRNPHPEVSTCALTLSSPGCVRVTDWGQNHFDWFLPSWRWMGFIPGKPVKPGAAAAPAARGPLPSQSCHD